MFSLFLISTIHLLNLRRTASHSDLVWSNKVHYYTQASVFNVRPFPLVSAFSFSLASFFTIPPSTSIRLTRFNLGVHNRSIWSSISSQLHLHSSTEPSSINSPPLAPPPPSTSTSSSSTDTNPTTFEFYDPRGLGAKVRNTRSRSNTPQAGNANGEGLSRESSLSAGHTKFASSPGGTFAREGSYDDSGDIRMRSGSEVILSLSLLLSPCNVLPTKSLSKSSGTICCYILTPPSQSPFSALPPTFPNTSRSFSPFWCSFEYRSTLLYYSTTTLDQSKLGIL